MEDHPFRTSFKLLLRFHLKDNQTGVRWEVRDLNGYYHEQRVRDAIKEQPVEEKRDE